MRTTPDLSMVAAAAVAVSLAACGQVPAPPTGQESTASGPAAPPATADPDPGTGGDSGDRTGQDLDQAPELVGQGMLLQSAPGAPVELCLGPVLTSYPPQCSGPEVTGGFSWDDVASERSGGVTWSSGSTWVVGRLDPDAGSFRLTRPVSADPPAGFTPPAVPEVRFPQLCSDPTSDVPDVDQAARTRGPRGADEEQSVQELLHSGGLDGYVTSWVSGGGPTLNVVVTGDPGRARAAVREVFSGPLCVEQRDLPTQQELLAAQQALHTPEAGLELLSSGAGGVSGLLEVQVIVADPATVEAVHEAVSSWLTPEQVVVTGVLQPLHGES